MFVKVSVCVNGYKPCWLFYFATSVPDLMCLHLETSIPVDEHPPTAELTLHADPMVI